MNRNAIKQWFITFPTWWVLDNIKDFEKDSLKSSWGIVCREKHEDGGFHYHMCIKLKVATTQSQMIKFYTQKFPEDFKRIHIRPVKDIRASIDYINKDPVELYEWGVLYKLPYWIQNIRDEFKKNEVELLAHFKRKEIKEQRRLLEIHQSEIESVYCYRCGGIDCPCYTEEILEEFRPSSICIEERGASSTVVPS